MSLNLRIDNGVAVLSNIARLMNDPRYSTSSRDLEPLLADGIRRFAIELAGVHDTGSALVGMLMTLSRRVRSAGGDVVLVRCSPTVQAYLEEMQLDSYWEILSTLEEVHQYYDRARDRAVEPD